MGFGQIPLNYGVFQARATVLILPGGWQLLILGAAPLAFGFSRVRVLTLS